MSIRKLTGNAPLLGHPLRGLAALGGYSILAATIATIAAIQTMAGTALTVTQSGEGISVGVPAGAVDAESALYLVWDSEDHGDELAAWPVANRVVYDGVLSSSAATYYFATNCLPANYCARVLAAKAVNVIDGYIYCGANQCVNTGILATDIYSLAIKYAIPATEGSTAWVLLGAARDNGTIARYSTHLYLRWTGQDQGFAFGNDLYNSSAVHEIAVGGGEVKLDGNVTKSGIPTGAMGTTAKTVLMSAGWYNNTIERYMKARWYHVRLNDKNGDALIDLVPALTNGSEAVFYDKVSHRYFGNGGSSTAALTYSGSASETNFTLAASAVMNSVTAATWTGGGETALLSDAGNWTPGLPGVFATATINGTGETPAVVPDGLTAYRILQVGAGGNGELVQSQGAVSASAINGVVVGSGAGNTGRYTMTGGTLKTTYGGSDDDALYVGTGAGTGYLDVGGNAYVSPKKLNIGTVNNSKGYMTVRDNGIVNVRGDINVGTYQNGCYGEVNQSGGIVTATNAWVKIAFAGTGKYTMTGGKLIIRGQLYAGYPNNSHGTLKQSGGEIYITEDFSIGGYNGSNKGTGDAEMTGGSLTVDRYFHVGRFNTGTFTQSGGNVTCKNWIAIGRYDSGVGVCTVTGGTFAVTGGGLNVGEHGIGTLVVGGTGIVRVTATGGIDLGAGAATNNNNEKMPGRGTVKMTTGGTIVAQTVKNGHGTATLAEFDGGTIRATADNANILNGLPNIVLKAGGLVLDTQGHNLTVNNCTFNVAPGGKITVTGGGTVTFANCTASLTAKPSEKFVFAETDGVFSGMPTFTDTKGWKVQMSADNKKISVVPPGFLIIVK